MATAPSLFEKGWFLYQLYQSSRESLPWFHPEIGPCAGSFALSSSGKSNRGPFRNELPVFNANLHLLFYSAQSALSAEAGGTLLSPPGFVSLAGTVGHDESALNKTRTSFKCLPKTSMELFFLYADEVVILSEAVFQRTD